MEKYYRQYDTCRQNEKPFCSVSCPFHLDVLDFQSKMAANNYNGAFKVFRNAVGFPDIVAAICPEYCSSVCPRAETDQSVQLNLLEKTCVAKSAKKDPIDYNVPMKDRKIAIVGAGISGLACALRLAQKKYQITIYEKTDRSGGRLWDILPPELFLEDILRQLQFEKYDLHYNKEIKSIDEIRNEGFEAVYAATGKGGNDFGALGAADGHCIIDGGIAIFAGGMLTGKDPVRALADGLDMAWSIEVFLKTGKLVYPEEAAPCRAVADPDNLIETKGVEPSDDGIFTDEEAAREADRCIRCQCDACMKYCDVCDYHQKWPMRIRDDVMATVAFSTSPSMLKKTPAKRLMSTCTQCGLCDEVCPENIEIGGMLLEARRSLHKQDTMPGAYHQFWLRDMEFANSELAAMTRKAPGQQRCAYAFFPGCQLGAADPRYVAEPYRWLLSKRPDTGLMLRCCSVPAEWAGNEELHGKAIEDIRAEWNKMGNPALIMACPACEKHFKKCLPEIETVSLYELLDQWGADWPEIKTEQAYSIFDPCTARHAEELEHAVRNLVDRTGICYNELPKGDKHGCCGYGGHGSIADPEFADFVARKRSGLSPDPYITYCINCRDIFIGEGKPALHILELLFNIDPVEAGLPDVTQRRRNRVDLKELLLEELWGEKMESKPEKCRFNLIIGAEMREKMNKQRMLEEDICQALETGEILGRRTYDPQKGTYICYGENGSITCWVEYRTLDGNYEIVSAYMHRMKIELEGVWNGRKTGIDLR